MKIATPDVEMEEMTLSDQVASVGIKMTGGMENA